MNEQSECSSVVWVVKIALYGSYCTPRSRYTNVESTHHDGRRDAGRRRNRELEFGLLSELAGQPFHEEGGEAAPCASSKAVIDHET